MSYDIELTKDDKVCSVGNHQEGGIIAMGGSCQARINITWNYAFFFYNFLDKRKGIRWLYGKTAQETISRLEKTVDKLSGWIGSAVYEEDYWAPTFGNARHSLSVLLDWAKQHPTAVWSGD